MLWWFLNRFFFIHSNKLEECDRRGGGACRGRGPRVRGGRGRGQRGEWQTEEEVKLEPIAGPSSRYCIILYIKIYILFYLHVECYGGF